MGQKNYDVEQAFGNKEEPKSPPPMPDTRLLDSADVDLRHLGCDLAKFDAGEILPSLSNNGVVPDGGAHRSHFRSLRRLLGNCGMTSMGEEASLKNCRKIEVLLSYTAKFEVYGSILESSPFSLSVSGGGN